MAIDLNGLITTNSSIRGGRPCIVETGITVHRIATWYRLGHSAEEIARQYPHIALAGVYAALAYYHADREAIDVEIDADEAIAQQLEAQQTAASPIAS